MLAFRLDLSGQIDELINFDDDIVSRCNALARAFRDTQFISHEQRGRN